MSLLSDINALLSENIPGCNIDQPLGFKGRGNKMKRPDGTTDKEGSGFENIVHQWQNPKKKYAEGRRPRTFGETMFVINFLTEDDGNFYDELKALAREDVSVLKNLVNLQKLYRSDDPQLSGKEAALAAGVVLQKLYRQNPKAAHYLGRMNWEPELINWMGFFDQVGDQTLAQFLGINSMEEIPLGQAGGAGDDMGTAEEAGVGAGDDPDDLGAAEGEDLGPPPETDVDAGEAADEIRQALG